jgi:hypothetical protein
VGYMPWKLTLGLLPCQPYCRLTATSTVFSCPTRLISDVQLLRAITAAINTNPLLLVAFEAVIWAPSGDQLDPMVNSVSRKSPNSPESSEKCAPRRILERFPNLCLQLPIRCAPNFDTAVVRLCCHELPNRVPTNALDKTVMLIDFAYSFLVGKEYGQYMSNKRSTHDMNGPT